MSACVSLVFLDQAKRPYKDTDGTAFADLLKRGCLAVVSSSYFERCLAGGTPFSDRENIPEECFISGEILMKQWRDHGAKFLVIISYPWLTKEHPDPNMFHLKRLVRVLKELKAYHGLEELGVIIDYCALWQNHGTKENDTRTPEQYQQFKEGLKEINTPYGHEEITSIKMMSVPKDATGLNSRRCRLSRDRGSDVCSGGVGFPSSIIRDNFSRMEFSPIVLELLGS